MKTAELVKAYNNLQYLCKQVWDAQDKVVFYVENISHELGTNLFEDDHEHSRTSRLGRSMLYKRIDRANEILFLEIAKQSIKEFGGQDANENSISSQ